MLRKLTLGIVAAATLSAMALAPSAASAKPWGGGGGGWGGGWGYHHHHFGPGFGIGYIGGGYIDRTLRSLNSQRPGRQEAAGALHVLNFKVSIIACRRQPPDGAALESRWLLFETVRVTAALGKFQ
jgi:hypothetical protein